MPMRRKKEDNELLKELIQGIDEIKAGKSMPYDETE